MKKKQKIKVKIIVVSIIALLIVLAAFVVLLLPVIPLKSLYTAAMVRGIREEEKHEA